MRRTLWTGLGIFISILAGWGPAAWSYERFFAYSYETETLPEDGLEYEQQVTYSNGKAQGSSTRWDMRSEVEYGLLPDLQTSVYLNYSQVHSSGVEDLNGDGSVDLKDREDKWKFEGVSSEWIYNVLSPYQDPIGLAFYFEGTVGETAGELEEKLLLQKNFFDDKLMLVFNAVVEEEWTLDHYEPLEGEFEMTFGASYKILPKFALGLEARNQRVYPENFSFEEHSVWSVGPNVHYGDEHWFATLTVLPQVAGHPDQGNGMNFDDNNRLEIRLIAGIYF